MKRIGKQWWTKAVFATLLLLATALTLCAQSRAKYVFYFIGDGMGVNQVKLAET